MRRALVALVLVSLAVVALACEQEEEVVPSTTAPSASGTPSADLTPSPASSPGPASATPSLDAIAAPSSSTAPVAQAQSVPDYIASDPAFVAAIPVGKFSRRIAVNKTTGRVYVTNLDSRDVTVIDGGTNQVLTTVPIDTRDGVWGPEAVAVDSTMNRIFVMDTWGEVWVIDGASNAVIGGTHPFEEGGAWPLDPGIAVNELTHRVYASDWAAGRLVAVLDGETFDVVARVDGLDSPGDLAVNQRTGQVFVAEPTGVRVIDGATNALLPEQIEIPGGGASGLIVDPESGRLFLTGWAAMHAVDILGGNQMETAEAPGCGKACSFVELSLARHRAYVFGRGELYTYDNTSNAILNKRAAPYGMGMAYNPANERLYLGGGSPPGEDHDYIYVYDATKLELPGPTPIRGIGASLPEGGGSPGVPATPVMPVAGLLLLATGVILLLATGRSGAC